MKETLLQFARYNVWANRRIIEVLLKMDDELLEKEIISSFSSLRTTVLHIWSAEFIWLQRLQLEEQPVFMMDIFKGSFSEACDNWLKASETLVGFIERQYDDKGLEHVFQYYDRQKRPHKKKVWEVLMHVFNHATYHRGQLVTMMRQAGVSKIPGTDYTTFTD